MPRTIRENSPTPSDLTSLYRQFSKSEDGTITIFALFMVFMMMIICGIGVDMMRHEMERTRIQAVSDRAVLAAADLDQSLDPEFVVRDYFAKSGMAEFVSDVDVDQGANYKIVTVDASTDVKTMFMHHTTPWESQGEDAIGREYLHVPSRATAEERVPKVEISLALDITTSMGAGTRIFDLKPAATAFIDTVLSDDATAQTSVSLIPYGGQVNPGPDMFDYLGAVRLPATPLDEAEGGIPEDESHGILPEFDEDGNEIRGGVGIDPDDPTRYVWPNQSSCPEIQDAGFNSTSLPPFAAYEQTPYFSIWNDQKDGVKDVGWCPSDENQIQYLSNNRAQINAVIENMLLYDGTGTQYAMQWALALLDPSTAPVMNALSGSLNIPSIFAGRPASYGDSETLKYIILMTDGGVSVQFRPLDEFGDQNAISKLNGSRSSLRYTEAATAENFALFNELCELAKTRSPRPIIIYTIAFETRKTAEADAMRDCASSPSHFFNSDGEDIADTFQAIARQINQLKLTQ